VPEDIIRADRLSKVYRLRGHGGTEEMTAVDDVSFALPEGSSLAVVGESGSGKTTLARMLVGLTQPSAGQITIAGHDRSQPTRRAADRRRRGRDIQIVFQDPYSSLDPRQSAVSCIDAVLKLHFRLSPAARADRALQLCDQVGLDERQARALPSALSGGQRQRVAIARALAAQPRILVLDEAVASLDVSIQAQILNLLADIRDSGISYILISHDLAVVRQITDHILVMRRGRVVEEGSTGQVLDAPRQPYTRLLRSSVPGHGWKPTRRAPAASGV
jgi:oligopeptide transport system ATP-binding protein